MLVEKDLTFKRALEIAESMQAADQNYREMRAVNVKEEPVNQVQDKPRRQNCHRCGYPGHLGNSCKHKEKICRNCYQKGLLARVCHNAPQEQGPMKKTRNRDSDRDCDRRKTRRVRQAEEESDSEEAEISNIREGKQRKAPPNRVPVKVDGINVKMEVDTGASLSLIS